MTQAKTVKQAAAEMPETVLTPTPLEFSRIFVKNSSKRQKFREKIRTTKE
jgi:NAD(P)H-hydrate repair Nnr-like enzyme with NAD(P)H-hydrate dehydratase domain